MRLAVPDTVRPLPLAEPRRAVQEFAKIIGELRDAPAAAAADLEAMATEAIDTAVASGVFLMAVVTPPDAAPALLTATVLEVPPSWSADTAERLRDSLDDVGGPDVRETITLDTGLGPAVIVHRVPGVEQHREGGPLALQLQAFVPEPGTGRMLLLTLASPSPHGWPTHQLLFAHLVASAQSAPDSIPDSDCDDSYENRTYRV